MFHVYIQWSANLVSFIIESELEQLIVHTVLVLLEKYKKDGWLHIALKYVQYVVFTQLYLK